MLGSRHVGVLATVAIAVVAVAWFWFGRSPDAAPDSVPAGSSDVPSGARDTATAPSAMDDSAELRTAIDASTDVRIASVPKPNALLPLTGVVVDGADRAIVGAEVVAVEELGAGFALQTESRQAEERARTVSGADGTFTLRVPFARRLTLIARADGFATSAVEPCYAEQQRRIVLEREASLEVTVVDAETRAPVGGVALEGWLQDNRRVRFDGVSDRDGKLRVEGLSAGPFLVDVTPPEHEAQLRVPVELSAGSVAQLTVELGRGSAVFGSVTDAASGQPIVGAEISAGWTFEKVVRTDANGHYRMQGAPGPGVPDMHARAAGYAAATQSVAGKGDQRIDFALSRGVAVRGRIVDAAGVGRADVYVAAAADLGVVAGIGHSDWRAVRSGPNGMFRIDCLLRDALYTLLIRERGSATLGFLLPPCDASGRDIDVGDIALREPAVVSGRVVDENGRGIAGAAVSMRGANADHDRLLGADPARAHRSLTRATHRDATADADGRFRFADLAGGSYEVNARVRSGPEAKTQTLELEAGHTRDDVEFVIRLGLAIAGRVVIEDAPGAMVLVRVRGTVAGEAIDRFATVAADGSFRVIGLPTGAFDVEVHVSKWANSEAAPWLGDELRAVAAGTEDLRLKLVPAAFVTGQVVDANGLPRSGVIVVGHPQGGDSMRDTTGPDGTFRLRVRPGTVLDLEYGEPAAAPPGLTVIAPAADRAKTYAGVSAGASGLVLVLP